MQLEVQEVEEKEDREGQVEVAEERGELKEWRTCTWMTSDETQTWATRCMWHDIKECDKVRAFVHAQVMCIMRVFM